MPAGLSEQVRWREDLRELLAGITRLPEDQRSALLLAELEDLDHREIAEIVGCPVNKVKALIYQARSTLIADRDALDTPCQDIREQLAVARGGELRRGRLRRHLNLCAGCRNFQLAVGVQRQSLATVLPVLPTAGLATAILGHTAAHTAGAAAGGAGVGGVGLSASGAATTSTAVGAGASAGGGSGIGTLLGGGLATKLAFGGTVAVLATAGAVAIRHPAHTDRRSMQSGSRHGALRRDGPSTSARVGGVMLNTAFVQAGEGAPGPEASGWGASASALGGVSGSAVVALSPGIAGAMTMPLTEVAPASPSQPTPTGSAAGVSGRQSHFDRQRPISKMRQAAQRKLRRQRLRAHRRLLRQRRVFERRQMLKRRRQLKRRQLAKRRSKQVAISSHSPAVAPPAPNPARPPHRHKPRTTTTSTSEASSSSSTSTTGTPTPKSTPKPKPKPKMSRPRRPQTAGGPPTGKAEAGASGTSSTTTGSATSKQANNGKPGGASDPGADAQACGGEMESSESTTVQPRRGTAGHTHTCPASQQEEA